MRQQAPYLLLALALGAIVSFLFLHRCSGPIEIAPPAIKATPEEEVAAPQPEVMPELQETESDTQAGMLPDEPGPGKTSRHPGALIAEIGQKLEEGDLATAGRLIGGVALTEEARERLTELSASGVLTFKKPSAAHEVGEMEVNARSRWALEIEDAPHGRDRIYFDLVREGAGWKVSRITLPPADGTAAPKAIILDPLGISDAFLQAALRQDFELAKEFVDSTKISDAKIAGLCILFEEGDYQIRSEKPLRGMFEREDAAGFLASVVTRNNDGVAQFSMTLQKSEDAGWQLSEINLDQLLADYAARVAGGDVYYTPLLKNPKGGDTLVLYFDFDADTLSQRTQRQLEIVADLLRIDVGKKLTISGHTDALGSENYNRELSARRAASVKDFLVRTGVDENQIVTLAQGQTEPRRPNFTESGDDNPSGRRANRRSEIYLDF